MRESHPKYDDVAHLVEKLIGAEHSPIQRILRSQTAAVFERGFEPIDVIMRNEITFSFSDKGLQHEIADEMLGLKEDKAPEQKRECGVNASALLAACF